MVALLSFSSQSRVRRLAKGHIVLTSWRRLAKVTEQVMGLERGTLAPKPCREDGAQGKGGQGRGSTRRREEAGNKEATHRPGAGAQGRPPAPTPRWLLALRSPPPPDAAGRHQGGPGLGRSPLLPAGQAEAAAGHSRLPGADRTGPARTLEVGEEEDTPGEGPHGRHPALFHLPAAGGGPRRLPPG